MQPIEKSKENKPPHGNPHAGLVFVTIDQRQVQVPYGNFTVVELKEMLGVPPEKELDEVKNNKLHALNDQGHFEVKGGEVFISHPRAGMSS